MDYRTIYKQVCKHAAEHLYSLEIYEYFEDEDAERVDRAIEEIQRQLEAKASRQSNEVSAQNC